MYCPCGCQVASSVPPPCMLRPEDPPGRCGVRLRVESSNRQEQDRLRLDCLHRVDRGGQNELSRVRSRALFHNYGYARRSYRLDRSTMYKGLALPAACVCAILVLAAIPPLASG